VFNREQPMLDTMDRLPWYRRLFVPASGSDLKTTLATADGGDADAQFRLGLKYSAGTDEGMDQDLVQAAEWYRKAANQDHALAQFNLSLMFASGQGVTRNDTTALMWTRKAAEGGDAGAQFNLGTRYHRASIDRLQMDSAESRIEAYKWFHLASAQGYKGSDAACERVALVMTREEVVDGNQRTAAFVVRKTVNLRNDSSCATTERSKPPFWIKAASSLRWNTKTRWAGKIRCASMPSPTRRRSVRPEPIWESTETIWTRPATSGRWSERRMKAGTRTCSSHPGCQ